MNKSTFTFCLALLLSTAAMSQPCKFSWKDLILPNGSTANFTTPAVGQPYQGPCLAFAFTAAIESMYEIENNLPISTPISQSLISTIVPGDGTTSSKPSTADMNSGRRVW